MSSTKNFPKYVRTESVLFEDSVILSESKTEKAIWKVEELLIIKVFLETNI